MTYAVSAYKVDKEFATENEARAYFEEIKNNFTYCELKAVDRNSSRYYSRSIEIFYK